MTGPAPVESIGKRGRFEQRKQAENDAAAENNEATGCGKEAGSAVSVESGELAESEPAGSVDPAGARDHRYRSYTNWWEKGQGTHMSEGIDSGQTQGVGHEHHTVVFREEENHHDRVDQPDEADHRCQLQHHASQDKEHVQGRTLEPAKIRE